MNNLLNFTITSEPTQENSSTITATCKFKAYNENHEAKQMTITSVQNHPGNVEMFSDCIVPLMSLNLELIFEKFKEVLSSPEVACLNK